MRVLGILISVGLLSACMPGGDSNVRQDNAVAAIDRQHLVDLGATAVHEAGATGEGVIIAVPDSGLRLSHVEFANANILNPTNFVPDEDPTDMTDTLGHGTSVNSLIVGKNLGIAPGATILPMKVTPGSSGALNATALDNAVAYSREQGAKVSNYSFNLGNTERGRDILDGNAAAGMLTVIAAGNEELDRPLSADLINNPELSPQAVVSTLLVGSVYYDSMTEQYEMSHFSNKAGTAQHRYLVAIGGNVNTAGHWDDDHYRPLGGTSYATPQVSGAAAVVWSHDPSLSASQVADILLESATDMGEPGVDAVFGHGMLNLKAAMQPLGLLGVPTGDSSAASVAASLSAIRLSPAFGDALLGSSSLESTLVLDAYKRPFYQDMRGHILAAPARDPLRSYFDGLGMQPQQYQLGGDRHSLDVRSLREKSVTVGFDDGVREPTHAITHFGVGTHHHGLHYSFQRGELYQGNQVSALPDGEWLSGNPTIPSHLASLGSRWSSAGVSGKGEGWDLGYAWMRNAPVENAGPSVLATMVSMGRQFGHAALAMNASLINEDGSILGTSAQGAFASELRAHTTSLGAMYSLAVQEGSRVYVSGTYGLTRISSNEAAMLNNWGAVHTAAYEAGFIISGDKTQQGVRLMRPLRVERGDVAVNTPVERTIDHQIIRDNVRHSLAPSGNEHILEGFVSLRSVKTGNLTLVAQYQHQPGHVRSSEGQKSVLLRGGVSLW